MQQGGLDFWQVGIIIKVALGVVLKPTAARVLEPRSMQCLRTFPKEKYKVARHFILYRKNNLAQTDQDKL